MKKNNEKKIFELMDAIASIIIDDDYFISEVHKLHHDEIFSYAIVKNCMEEHISSDMEQAYYDACEELYSQLPPLEDENTYYGVRVCILNPDEFTLYVETCSIDAAGELDEIWLFQGTYSFEYSPEKVVTSNIALLDDEEVAKLNNCSSYDAGYSFVQLLEEQNLITGDLVQEYVKRAYWVREKNYKFALGVFVALQANYNKKTGKWNGFHPVSNESFLYWKRQFKKA